MKEKLNKINNELKDYINESEFVSNKCRNKVISLLGEEFGIKFNLDNFKTIDVIIKENGHIEMRGDDYSPNVEITSFKDIEERYENFKIKADKYLHKKEKVSENKKLSSNILNLLIIMILFIFLILLFIYVISSLLKGDFLRFLSLGIVILYWIIPGIKENIKGRIQSAKIFLKNLLKK